MLKEKKVFPIIMLSGTQSFFIDCYVVKVACARFGPGDEIQMSAIGHERSLDLKSD